MYPRPRKLSTYAAKGFPTGQMTRLTEAIQIFTFIGLYCSCTCKQNELRENILQNLFHNLTTQTVIALIILFIIVSY